MIYTNIPFRRAANCLCAFCLTVLCSQYLPAQDTLYTPSSTLQQKPTHELSSIILDIYNSVTELGQTDFEQLQNDLYALYENPIDLNHTSDEELSQLYFLSPQQIDAILLYADKHPFLSLYELRLIPCLTDYEIRNILPFVRIGADTRDNKAMHAREVFAYASHELLTRVDARNIEQFEGTDPIYVQTRYRFNYQRRVIFGAQLRRPAGGNASDLQYGAYLFLRDIGHIHTLVAGNYQASFGQGLVFANAFHAGKSAYILSAGQQQNGLRYYSSVDGNGLQGAGATLRWQLAPHTRLDATALYSIKRANDSTRHHLIGANITLRHKKLEFQLNAAQNIWSDTIHPRFDAAYNTHYFRGTHQAVLGTSFRYTHHLFELFGELATAENYARLTSGQQEGAHWGFGTLLGTRIYPTNGLSFIALYRYYSPYFDNPIGYAFSETSRLNDENGGYLGFELTRFNNWRLSGYADLFYFSGPKYGIPTYPTLGYDAMLEAKYLFSRTSLTQDAHTGFFSLRTRARKKGTSTYSTRARFNYQLANWSFSTIADANMVPQNANSNAKITYGLSIAQDINYTLPSAKATTSSPLSITLRLQFFDAREWVNRIYLYEHDVLYAFAIPSTYGLGSRAYLCLRWQIIPQLALYLRASETIYARSWYTAKHPDYFSSCIPTRTDIHLLLRAKL